jgi:hypothetical protein
MRRKQTFTSSLPYDSCDRKRCCVRTQRRESLLRCKFTPLAFFYQNERRRASVKHSASPATLADACAARKAYARAERRAGPRGGPTLMVRG